LTTQPAFAANGVHNFAQHFGIGDLASSRVAAGSFSTERFNFGRMRVLEGFIYICAGLESSAVDQ
jgi:hypothetical protein